LKHIMREYVSFLKKVYKNKKLKLYFGYRVIVLNDLFLSVWRE
jgi:hypothetical protein